MSRMNPSHRRPLANGPATPYADARITAERVAMALRSRFDPLPTLNPQRLVQYLQQFDYGYLGLAARTWDAMERRDDRLASVSAKAKSALARYGFEVRMRANLPLALREEAAKHQAALEYLYTHCTVTNAVREMRAAASRCWCARWPTPSASATACMRSCGSRARTAR